jgi:ATP-citrate lyase alpha-subunit
VEAIKTSTIRTVAIIAEGVPERKTRILIARAKKRGKWIIGPATVGGISAGAFRIGNTGGTIENIIASKLYRPGSVGFVSKSGGMSNEMFRVIADNTNGIYEGIAIGGDAFPGSTFYEHIERFEQNEAIKMIVLLGELGGTDEYKIADALKNKKITKPLVAWVTGTCAKEFSGEVQFGHAGAKSGNKNESALAKNQALKDAGAIVPHSFNDFGDKIREVFGQLESKGVIKKIAEPALPRLPEDFDKALKEKRVRKSTDIVCSISSDIGEEATYGGIPISEIQDDASYSRGFVIGLLWFKKKLPANVCEYIEMILKTVADHGPCVSGAHNAIVTARAGRDLVSALASGILTIGPRFGGAIDDAARTFKSAFERGLTPEAFVKEMKEKGEYISGIGHRIKSTKNPDARVESLKKFAFKHFASTELLTYAIAVEKITTAKKDTLILNVDGCIGVTFIDMMRSERELFSTEEIDEIIEIGCLNGLFVLGRSIGIMGHYFDQKRLKQPLYRYPQSDVLYLKE